MLSKVVVRAARRVWCDAWHEWGGHRAYEPPSDRRPRRYVLIARTAGAAKSAVMAEKMTNPISPPRVEGCWGGVVGPDVGVPRSGQSRGDRLRGVGAPGVERHEAVDHVAVQGGESRGTLDVEVPVVLARADLGDQAADRRVFEVPALDRGEAERRNAHEAERGKHQARGGLDDRPPQ